MTHAKPLLFALPILLNLPYILAGVGFPFPCDSLGCNLCATERMTLVCSTWCNQNCIKDENVIGGFADKSSVVEQRLSDGRVGRPGLDGLLPRDFIFPDVSDHQTNLQPYPALQPAPHPNQAETSTVRPTRPPKPKCPKADWSPCVPHWAANFRFEECCLNERLPTGCVDLCNYGVSRAQMETAFMWARTCPVTHLPKYLKCASGGENAIPCCEANKLLDGALEICRPYCNAGPGVPPFTLDYLGCIMNMENIMSCHQAHLQPLDVPLRPGQLALSRQKSLS